MLRFRNVQVPEITASSLSATTCRNGVKWPHNPEVVDLPHTIPAMICIANINFYHYKNLDTSQQQLVTEAPRIAVVLGEADREIALLKKNLAGLRELQKGLMQKLLTVQIRGKAKSKNKG